MTGTGIWLLVGGLLVVIALCAVIGFVIWRRLRARPTLALSEMDRLVLRIGIDTHEAVRGQLTEAARARGAADATVAIPEELRFGRILWVDDDADAALSESIALTQLGLAVTHTTHAAAALAYATAVSYCVVVASVGARTDGGAAAAFADDIRAAHPQVTLLAYAPEREAADAAAPAAFPTVCRSPAELVSTIVATLNPRP